jgi:hypothetical protein
MAEYLIIDKKLLPRRRIAILVLAAFLITFLSARILVLMIMTRYLPDFFVYIGGTHVHHLNLGIILLSVCGAAMLFFTLTRHGLRLVSILYGVGLALTFDEFGMWLHLGGSYWQRASFDAMSILAAILGLIAFAPHPREWRTRHSLVTAILVVQIVLFGHLLQATLNKIEGKLGPRLEEIEHTGPQ